MLDSETGVVFTYKDSKLAKLNNADKKIKAGVIIEIYLDIKSGTLSFKSKGKLIGGFAFTEPEFKAGSYRLTISTAELNDPI